MSATVWQPWLETDKGDPRCRRLADGHYTRRTVGHPLWTRPGWNQVLWTRDETGDAVWCWFRPKWESGIAGTERFDRLRAIECSMFRNTTAWRSSALIRAAVAAVLAWEHARDVAWPDGLITGIDSAATAARRSGRALPGECFRRAGWEPFKHAAGRADVWLRCSELPRVAAPARRERRGQFEFDEPLIARTSDAVWTPRGG